MGRADAGGLRLRTVSALALAPLPLAAIWFGGVWLALLTAGAGAVMAWEWGMFVPRGRGCPGRARDGRG